jgi:hypothetical protein
VPTASPSERFVVLTPADLRDHEQLSVLSRIQLASLEALVGRFPRCSVAVETCGGSLTVRVWDRTERLVCVRHVFPRSALLS